MNRTLKKTLKMVPKTTDDEFDRRVAASKSLHSAIRAYDAAVRKAKSALEDVTSRFLDVKTAFIKITDSCNSDDNTTNVVTAFSASVERMKTEIFAEFGRAIDQDILATTHEMKNMESDCDKAESERQKLRKDFDVYRELVRQKESEYSKKSKDLTGSKSYGSDVVKRNEFEQRFNIADDHFKDVHSQYMSKSSSMTAQSISSFMNTCYNFFNRMSAEFGALVSSGQNGGGGQGYGPGYEQNYNQAANQMSNQPSNYGGQPQNSVGEDGYNFAYH